MKIIVFGATGYLGLPIAQALVRNGHSVVGVSRTASKNELLLANEIIPASGDISSPSTWGSHLSDADAVISAVSSMLPADQMTELFKVVTDTASRVRPSGMPRLAWLFLSGTWAHGDDRNTLRSDGGASSDKVPAVAQWLAALEKEVLESKVVDGIVIRAAMCYGREGSLWSALFQQAETGEIRWPGSPGAAYATIHVDDLASLFVLAVEKSPIVRGLILDAANDATESVDGILHAFAAHVGIPPAKIAYRPVESLLDEALSITTRVRPCLGRSLLGWSPRKPSVMDGMATYYASYKASL